MTRAGRLSRSAVASLPTGSAPETLLAVQLEQAGIPFEREFRFDPDRKYRADFHILPFLNSVSPFAVHYEPSLLIEVEGGVWNRGAHVRGGGFESGCEKQALAVIAGYRYLRVTSAQVEVGRALEWIKAALA